MALWNAWSQVTSRAIATIHHTDPAFNQQFITSQLIGMIWIPFQYHLTGESKSIQWHRQGLQEKHCRSVDIALKVDR